MVSPPGQENQKTWQPYMESTHLYFGRDCMPSLRSQLYGADGDKLTRLHGQPWDKIATVQRNMTIVVTSVHNSDFKYIQTL